MKKIILIILLLVAENIIAEDYYAKISLRQQDGKDGQQDAIEGSFKLAKWLKIGGFVNFNSENVIRTGEKIVHQMSGDRALCQNPHH